MNVRVLVLDTETSGLKAPIGVCEIGFIELNPDTLEEIGRHRSLIDPEQHISASASGIHRITDDMVQDAPTLSEFFEVVMENQFSDANVLMIAHNSDFDYPLVKDYLGKSKPLCTLKLARRIYTDVEDHKLATLKYEFGLGKGGVSHSAEADVEDCADLLRKIVKDTGMGLAELMDFQYKPRVIDIMPFSKDHKGKPLKDVPKSFWVWLQRQPGPHDPDLTYSVNLLHPDIFQGISYDSPYKD